ncbi:MAG: 30S ribosomal protein S9 [Pirellulaceae bacterium]|jgi:small subunit ribosomal protein S9|nr:30S ribosomal protein S9 [Pirellulaceae bacterium]MDP6467274.1 30S ribosomal protein S9 [Pirellulaceae bacterium]MDP7302090.1 30S ribosomal protein S9 [Pirellulaceae bacterium]HJN13494.1 30S ribosomal protein S9 [Pirellulaceae bacterium]
MPVVQKRDKINGDALGTGRRKSSVARVRIREGKGAIKINNRPIEEYFANDQDRAAILAVLDAAERRDAVDVLIRAGGGGTTGQAGACRMGIARALVSYDEELFPAMRDGGFLTRDSRMKERKKCGLHGARRGTQFSKR